MTLQRLLLTLPSHQQRVRNVWCRQEEVVSNLAKGEKILKLFGFNFFFSMLKLFILCICIMCILSYTPTHQCILSYTPTHQPSHFKDKHSKSPTIQVGCDNHYKCTNCDCWVSGKSRWTKICHIYLIRFLLTWVGVGLGLTLAQWCIAPPLRIVPQTPMRFLVTWVGFGDDSGSIVLQPPMRFIFDLQTFIDFRRLVYGLGLWQENSSKCFQQYNIREDGG